MSKNDEEKDSPPNNLDGYTEPEDWDLPPTITEDDECPEILENVEPEEAFETLFDNLDLLTILSLIGGIIVAVLFYLLFRFRPSTNSIILMVIGFVAGLLLVFGASELIILGVKGIQDKLNFNPYIGGILQAIGAALAELVIIIFLLISSKQMSMSSDPITQEHGSNLAITAITLILTTVIINIFFLGLSIIYASKEKPFDLPKELTFFEANLVLGMMVFSFVIMIFGFYTEFTRGTLLESFETFDRGFEILIGLALVLVYFIFLMVLIRNYGKKTSTPQTLIVEFFPDEDDVIIEESSSSKFIQSRLISNGRSQTKSDKSIKCDTDETEESDKENSRGKRTREERLNALATLRRFPWYIIIFIFILGTGGIIWGGQILSNSIEDGIEIFEGVPVLVYSVVVGLVSSSPELIVTFRGLLKQDRELKEVGLVHQVSAINQTFFILFGVPFIISGIFNIGIPVALEITVVMGGIFIMSVAELMMIMDDNKFDLLEGVVITILATVSLLALTLIGGLTTEGESARLALQLVTIGKLM
ncbi:MAG: hypothetical protein FK731_14080 [Asgard group archaeon]|nr:hypothetical protein [Asgard group archaeon]